MMPEGFAPMGLRIGKGSVERRWSDIVSAAGEAGLQAALASTGDFTRALPGVFKAWDRFRGEDDPETRATALVVEAMAYATASVLTWAVSARGMPPGQAAVLLRYEKGWGAKEAPVGGWELEREHLDRPGSFPQIGRASCRERV